MNRRNFVFSILASSISLIPLRSRPLSSPSATSILASHLRFPLSASLFRSFALKPFTIHRTFRTLYRSGSTLSSLPLSLSFLHFTRNMALVHRRNSLPPLESTSHSTTLAKPRQCLLSYPNQILSKAEEYELNSAIKSEEEKASHSVETEMLAELDEVKLEK